HPGESLENHTAPDQPPVDEDTDTGPLQLLYLHLGNKSAQPQLRQILAGFFFGLPPPRWRLGKSRSLQWLKHRQRKQLIKNFLPENLINACAVIGYWRRNQHSIGGRMQFEMLVRMCQRIVRHQRGDMRKLSS